MQTIIMYLTLMFSVLFMDAQNVIEVNVTDISNDKGTLIVGLYNEEGKFLDETYMSEYSKITNNSATVVFTDVPNGTYAISCYHDADDNGRLNMLLNVFPKESYGTSNNAKGFFGPPKWEDAKFEINDGDRLVFEIKI